MRLYVGCAMWTHKSWPAAGLESYANWCNAVEGNTTFYATPARHIVASWARQTDPDFRFVIKLPKSITHDKRLTDIDEKLRPFLDAMEPLGPRIHALWVQLPGSFGPTDLGRLKGIFRRLPSSYRYAVEVRHRGFFDEPQPLEDVLVAANAEWVTFDTTAFFQSLPTNDAERETWTKKPRMPRRTVALTDIPIIRYLDRPATIRESWPHWIDAVAGWLREGRSPTVFLHTPDNAEALALARQFHDEVRARVPELEPLPAPPTLF